MASFLSKVKDKARNRKLNFSSRRATDKDVAKTGHYLKKYNDVSDQVERSTGVKLPKVDNIEEYASSLTNITNVLPENNLAEFDLGLGLNQQSLSISPHDKSYVDNITIKNYKTGPTRLSAHKTLFENEGSNVSLGGGVDTGGNYNVGIKAAFNFKEGGPVNKRKKTVKKKPRGWGCARMTRKK
tara:strand:+ start:206 stop:757 length:552 start_codon:yes stop_codon:yes gene_type:complete